MNITELARKLKITPNELKQALPKLGFHIGPRAIQIPDKQAEKVIEIWHEKRAKEKTLAKVKEKISQVKEKQEAAVVSKSITIPPTIQVYRLAEKLNLPVTKVMNELIKNGVLASVNENLDYEIAAIIVENLGFKADKGDLEEEGPTTLVKDKLKQALAEESKAKLKTRAPVVVVMGHVDHGKSAILQSIREIEMLSREAGGITQHIGAYQVKKNSYLITFIDTPGHEAFQSMRARGGEVADIAVLVIAADDGIQPQTLESIKIIQQENLPFIVAINKIDKPEADLEKIKKGLSEINLMPEDWGGKIICVPVSAKTKQGIEDLLEMISLIAEMRKDKLVSNPEGSLVGIVIESHLDLGFGPVASVIIYNGTLKKGDNVIIGQTYGRLRSIKDQGGNSIDRAGASLPVQIFGLKSLPQAGDLIEVVPDGRVFKKRTKQMSLVSPLKQGIFAGSYSEETTSDQPVKRDKKAIKYLNLVLRADVLGSLEAVVQALEKLEHPEVKIKVLKKGLGKLTEADVDLAKATQAWLIGFNAEISGPAKQLATELELKVSTYQVIYDLIQDLKQGVNELISPEIFEEKIGKLEVLRVFQQKGRETILGGKVIEGKVFKNTIGRVWHPVLDEKSGQTEPELKGEGKIGQLQINKKDVEEAKSGVECGIKFIGRPKIEVGDVLEIYQEVKKERKI
ncbi:translation initiation factor IF-2 [Patescibacteria group bacterium]|nr:translation initiation factor IF-2 [Patescibacteria group bacterium]